jgi:hypothetical protein
MASFVLWFSVVSTFPFSAEIARNAIRSFDLAEIVVRLTTTADKPNVLAARGPDEAGEMVKEYFDSIGRKALVALRNDADTSLALQAAWALALDADDVKAPPCPKRFVRFFERRTGLKVPLFWEYAVVKARLEARPPTRDRRGLATPPPTPRARTAPGARGPTPRRCRIAQCGSGHHPAP